MQARDTDLTFFTNQGERILLHRFEDNLPHTDYFDVLVGYFHASGFRKLASCLQSVKKSRILIGLGLDQHSFDEIQAVDGQFSLQFETHHEIRKAYKQQVVREMADPRINDESLEVGVSSALALLQQEVQDPLADEEKGGNGRCLEIRVYPAKNLHAKVYIGRYKQGSPNKGFVITGSSNISYSGFL